MYKKTHIWRRNEWHHYLSSYTSSKFILLCTHSFWQNISGRVQSWFSSFLSFAVHVQTKQSNKKEKEELWHIFPVERLKFIIFSLCLEVFSYTKHEYLQRGFRRRLKQNMMTSIALVRDVYYYYIVSGYDINYALRNKYDMRYYIIVGIKVSRLFTFCLAFCSCMSFFMLMMIWQIQGNTKIICLYSDGTQIRTHLSLSYFPSVKKGFSYVMSSMWLFMNSMNVMVMIIPLIAPTICLSILINFCSSVLSFSHIIYVRALCSGTLAFRLECYWETRDCCQSKHSTLYRLQ